MFDVVREEEKLELVSTKVLFKRCLKLSKKLKKTNAKLCKLILMQEELEIRLNNYRDLVSSKFDENLESEIDRARYIIRPELYYEEVMVFECAIRYKEIIEALNYSISEINEFEVDRNYEGAIEIMLIGDGYSAQYKEKGNKCFVVVSKNKNS